MDSLYKKVLVQQAFVGGAFRPLSEDGKCIHYTNGQTLCVEVDDDAHWKMLWEEKYPTANKNNSYNFWRLMKTNGAMLPSMKAAHEIVVAKRVQELKDRLLPGRNEIDDSMMFAGATATSEAMGALKVLGFYAGVVILLLLTLRECDRSGRDDRHTDALNKENENHIKYEHRLEEEALRIKMEQKKQ